MESDLLSIPDSINSTFNSNHITGRFPEETKQNLCHRFPFHRFYSFINWFFSGHQTNKPLQILLEMHHGSFYGGLTKALTQIHFVTPSVTINQLAHACLRVYCKLMQLRHCRNPIWFSAGCQVSKELIATSLPAFSFINAVFLHSGLFGIKIGSQRDSCWIISGAAVFNHRDASLNNKSPA